MPDGERAFLAWLAEQDVSRHDVPIGIGDDCAAVRIGDRDLLVTTDMLLDGTHFDSQHHTPEQIGRKAVACSLSDLAAMAARPVGAVAAAGLTRGRGIEFARRMFLGMKGMADQFDCPIVGGDTTSWSQPGAVCVTMFGLCPPGRSPVRRSGAQPGDAIYVTGPLGGSILGRHLTFEPQIELADRLAERVELHAMIDVSDGLAIDLSRICQASGVGAVLDESRVEAVISDDARRLSDKDGIDPLHHALFDGEDFELLVVTPVQELDESAFTGLRRVGQIAEADFHLRRKDGTVQPLKPDGYEHPL